ncbi:D-alanyl-D-alanine carboxypeptidase/D-alanyl-D-alanine endopeptidase [Amycolatopsis nigrescens]|uniref:D-alanyl-D-alanine carboxypeptidase/D-alanyl-D-alanine endopeptidase n=1 Tax=Amycolatopsis nigrescens TaxID=381445 RepID=UPI0003A8D6D7|nr:D-alanyl-D-alanine carboxypeptidase/D-alanyl-D-alanine-endopeptidase [Amycolatopsis nigrescens]
MATSRPLRVTVLLLLLAGLLAGPAGAPTAQGGDSLGRDLDTILADPSLAGADVGVVVRAASTGEVLYTRQSDRRRQPASNTKLLTAATALDVLGPGYRFHTGVAGTGRRLGSVLTGDLHLRGGGDPTMLAADYDKLAATVAATGVRVVRGGLIADDTFFDRTRLGLGWAWDDEPYYYSAQTSALTIAPDTDYDAGSVIVRVRPGTPGGPARVEFDPPSGYLRAVNTATTGPAGGAASVTVDREHGDNTFTVSGSIPAGADPAEEYMAVWEPSLLAAAVFRDALAKYGVRVLGGTTAGGTPQQAEVLAGRDSMPLGELLTPFMKLSNNMHGEALVKAAGRAAGADGTWPDGLSALDKALPGLGIDPAAMSTVDGSGLSRMDQVAPDQLSALLLAARGKPWFDRFYASLPVAGVADPMIGGTLRNRMRGTAAEGKVHAKTGSLTGVSALSGYVTAADGTELVFAMVANQTLRSSRPLEDAVAVRLAQYGGAVDPPRRPAVMVADAPGDELECSWTKSC